MRLQESDLRSTLVLLSGIEAKFRVDFSFRCNKRLKDELSRHFREVKKQFGEWVWLDEDILEGWRDHESVPPIVVGDLRAAFKFRHWLAHGRWWSPKVGRKYDFDYVRTLAEAVEGFPFAV